MGGTYTSILTGLHLQSFADVQAGKLPEFPTIEVTPAKCSCPLYVRLHGNSPCWWR